MSKGNKLYKIFMTSMIVIIAGMLLATGIIAIQKSMKLKANIEFLPGINVEIYVNEESENGLLFRNFDKDTNNKIYVNSTYCELGATTLTMNNNFVTAYGNNFTLVVKNYSGFTIETNITSTATAKIGEEPVDAVVPEITPATAQIDTGKSGDFVVTCEPIIPQETILAIKFEELMLYDIKATINGEDVLIGEYYQKSIEQPITINYPSTFTYAGDLMSAVVGVSEVTATQITIAANTTGDITIVPKGYTIGTYVDTDITIFTPNTGGENTIEYEAFKNYKYLQFNHTNSNTYSKRWIIIGGGKSETTTYGTGATVNADSLESNQLLLLSEKLIETQYYDNNVYTSFLNYDANKLGLYYQSDVRYLCRTYTKEEGSNNNLDMAAYTSRMAQKTIQTSWYYTSINYNETYNSNGNVDTTDYMFLLASNYTGTDYAGTGYERYAKQEFLITDYLGDDGDARRICYNSSNSASSWWLRSGLYDSSRGYSYAILATTGGDTYDNVGTSTGNGVRPSFILNLA